MKLIPFTDLTHPQAIELNKVREALHQQLAAIKAEAIENDMFETRRGTKLLEIHHYLRQSIEHITCSIAHLEDPSQASTQFFEFTNYPVEKDDFRFRPKKS